MTAERRDRGTARPRDAGPWIERASHGPEGSESPWVQLRSATYHPFIFQRMVGAADRAAKPGDIVNVYDKGGRRFGRGLFNPRSQIVVRMLTHDDVQIDEAFWRSRLERAVELRRGLRIEDVTDAYRLVHAEGDGLSGLVAERYGDCLVLEIFSLGIYQRWRELGAMLGEILGKPSSLDRPGKSADAWRILVRADRSVEELEGFRVEADQDAQTRRIGHDDEPTKTTAGQIPRADSHHSATKAVTIREHGIRYRVDMAEGHKTGFFCDQRDNRLRFGRLCRDATVLDLCCYTGGFGLAAKVLGGAREVTSVDLDESALAIARENMNLNQARIDLVHSDAFIYLRQMIANRRTFDAVVLDPPKLAASRPQLEEAMRKYFDLNGLAMQVVRPGGFFLTCSCSGLVSRGDFVETVQMASRRVSRTLQMIDLTGAAGDHPVMMSCPESAYLKAAWFRVL